MSGRGQEREAVRRGPSVSCDAIRKSGRVLYAFSSFYLPFYGRSLPDLFAHYDVFGCISAGIYDVDEMIELGGRTNDAMGKLDELAAYVRHRLSWDARFDELFDNARQYYEFEARLLRGDREYSLDELREMAGIRSFDFRLLHRALVQRMRAEYDESVFLAFRSFETIMEIEDDLGSWEIDRQRGTFNILCLAAGRQPAMAASFVEHCRSILEMDFNKRLNEVGELDRDRYRRLVARYREIVPRPEMPTVAAGE